jgi:hypothetical protein
MQSDTNQSRHVVSEAIMRRATKHTLGELYNLDIYVMIINQIHSG